MTRRGKTVWMNKKCHLYSGCWCDLQGLNSNAQTLFPLNTNTAIFFFLNCQTDHKSCCVSLSQCICFSFHLPVCVRQTHTHTDRYKWIPTYCLTPIFILPLLVSCFILLYSHLTLTLPTSHTHTHAPTLDPSFIQVLHWQNRTILCS